VDPRGRKTESLAAAGSLSRLETETKVAFPTIVRARRRTVEQLEERRRAFRSLQSDRDVAVVLMGSWGRLETTAGSDNDFMCLVDGDKRPEKDVRPSVETTWEAMGSPGKRPGKEAIFGVPVFSSNLRKIGLEDDGNKNLTRRMLLLLEARCVLGDEVYRSSKQALLDSYLQGVKKHYHPPRFLLNDVFRYWRTIAVDFERKHRDRAGQEWGLRSAKLRTSRPLLFASGLLPLLECRRLLVDEYSPFLAEQFDATPIDRVASCFLRHDRADSGARTLLAYDAFLTMLDDETSRKELEFLSYDDRESSEVLRRVRELEENMRKGFLSLIFETPDLYAMVREYAIF
jgi:hypothetical protein